MALLRLLAILIVATVCYVTLIDTAAVRSEEFAEKLQRMALDGGGENLSTQRAVESPEDEFYKRICYSTPCGWTVYDPFTRVRKYFLKNTCNCPDKSYKCIKTDDDLSVNAYVFRCRQNTTADDIEAPEDAH